MTSASLFCRALRGRAVLRGALLATLALPTKAQPPTPAVRAFFVPWLEGNSAWHTGQNSPYYTLRVGAAHRHLGAGAALEVMPSPRVGIGLGISVVGLGGEYVATYRATEFFSQTPVVYSLKRQLNLTYLRLPLYVRLTPHLIGPVRAYGLAGFEPALRLSARANGSDVDDDGRRYADDYRVNDVALLGGAGFEWWLSASSAILVGLHYRHGISNIQLGRPPYPGGDNPFGLPPRAYQSPPDVTYPLRNRSLALVVGLKFGSARAGASRVSPPPAAPARPDLQTL